MRFSPPAEGVCLPGSRTGEYLREVPREVVDMRAPVQVSPAPTHLIRILMDAAPVEECPALNAPELPDRPTGCLPTRGPQGGWTWDQGCAWAV
jgi:hypothetical protein